MKQFIYFFSGLLLLFISTTRVVAQEVSDYSQLSEEDYSKIVLPPLSVLFENAKNSPIYEMADVKARIERKLLQKEKWSFLGFFSLRGSYQYGMFGNESTYTDVAVALSYLLHSSAKWLHSRCRSKYSIERFIRPQRTCQSAKTHTAECGTRTRNEV